MMDYQSKLASNDLTILFEAILQLKTVEECYRFFEDLSTIKELQDMGQRFMVAKMLFDKKPYYRISEQTKASTATISRVNKSLVYGAEGYKLILERLKSQMKVNQE
jgi:TrpR-related protein YerC/YecD